MDQIIASSKYSADTVVQDIPQFIQLLVHATAAVTASADISEYFRTFDVDYYSVASRKLDLTVRFCLVRFCSDLVDFWVEFFQIVFIFV